MKISITELNQKIIDLLMDKGFSDKDSQATADYLVWAEKSGVKTQGIMKLTGPEPLQNVVSQYEPKVDRDTKISQLIDGGANPAPMVIPSLTNL